MCSAHALRSLGHAAAFGFLVAGCGASATPPVADLGSAPVADLSYVSTDPLIAQRPYDYAGPSDYDAKKSYPLIVELHGYGATGYFIDHLIHLSEAVDRKQFVCAWPEATRDKSGATSWNYGEDPTRVDDVAYVDAVIADMSARYHVDPDRVYVIGHSNGAGMTWRYLYERSAKLAAAAPIAGSYTPSPAPTITPRSLLQVSPMDPNPMPPPMREDVVTWAGLDQCQVTTDTSSPNLDLDNHVAGAETVVEKWSGCAPGTAVEYWQMRGAMHNPSVQPNFPDLLTDWLFAHPRKAAQ